MPSTLSARSSGAHDLPAAGRLESAAIKHYRTLTLSLQSHTQRYRCCLPGSGRQACEPEQLGADLLPQHLAYIDTRQDAPDLDLFGRFYAADTRFTKGLVQKHISNGT